jgi:hypothetical protein
MTDEEEKNSKSTTLRIETSSNDLNSTPKEVNFAQYVHHRDR